MVVFVIYRHVKLLCCRMFRNGSSSLYEILTISHMNFRSFEINGFYKHSVLPTHQFQCIMCLRKFLEFNLFKKYLRGFYILLLQPLTKLQRREFYKKFKEIRSFVLSCISTCFKIFTFLIVSMLKMYFFQKNCSLQKGGNCEELSFP